MIRSLITGLAWGIGWCVATALDLLILTVLIYSVGHWVLGVW